jgi:3',5'-nucleoside bisphosphate phosphatase
MKGSPFTQLCQTLATHRNPARADLHLHTTFSDGEHAPGQLVERAVRANLKAIAVTDHDTIHGAIAVREIAASLPQKRLEIVIGVELTCTDDGHLLHLLGYFLDDSNASLGEILARQRRVRRSRILAMAEQIRLANPGIDVGPMLEDSPEPVALGRRHLAKAILAKGLSTSMHRVFQELIAPASQLIAASDWVGLADGIRAIHESGGVASLAHPPEEIDDVRWQRYRDLGLDAIECEYPWPTSVRTRELRGVAGRFGYLVTGGSDSHDTTNPRRAVGARSVSDAELDKLKSHREAKSRGS